MLIHLTLDNLQGLWLTGMVNALKEHMDRPDIGHLSVEQRLGLIVNQEMTARCDRQLQTSLRQAKWRLAATIDDIDDRHPRRRA